jgi:glycosyltransferase involved in cell wall biosynthesis
MTGRLRIVIAALHYHPDCPGGSARLAFDEARYLAARGHEVWLVTQDMFGRSPAYMIDDGVHLLRYQTPQAFAPRRIALHRALTRALLERHIRGAVDCVHGHSLHQYAGALGLYAGRARTCYSVHSPVRAELLASCRGARILERAKLNLAARVNHRLEHKCLAESDVVTVFSEFTQMLVGKLHGSREQARTRVLPGWVDCGRFQIVEDRQAEKERLGWPTDRPVLFTLRRLVPRMGLDRLLQAAHQIHVGGQPFHLVIAGSGPLRGELEALARRVGLNGSVEFAGAVPDEELPRMYGSADAFVLPTAKCECFGLIAVEALACGRPVLATPVGAIPEVIAPIERMWLARDESVEGIARLLEAFLTGALPRHDPAELRRVVAEKYSSDRRIPEFVAAALGDQVLTQVR